LQGSAITEFDSANPPTSSGRPGQARHLKAPGAPSSSASSRSRAPARRRSSN